MNFVFSLKKNKIKKYQLAIFREKVTIKKKKKLKRSIEQFHLSCIKENIPLFSKKVTRQLSLLVFV